MITAGPGEVAGSDEMREPDSKHAQCHVSQEEVQNGSIVKTKGSSESGHLGEDPYGPLCLLG